MFSTEMEEGTFISTWRALSSKLYKLYLKEFSSYLSVAKALIRLIDVELVDFDFGDAVVVVADDQVAEDFVFQGLYVNSRVNWQLL